nr:Acetyltransferase (GNAT) family [uncultured bacterium]
MEAQEVIQFLNATQDDLSELISLLADDELGKVREQNAAEIDSAYQIAFQEITSDKNNELIVGKRNGKVIAVLQVTYIPGLTLRGSKRALIEGVRVSSQLRGQGTGRKLFYFAFEQAKKRGCKVVQLTTNKTRTDAHRFYESVGFKGTHEGFKFAL